MLTFNQVLTSKKYATFHVTDSDQHNSVDL